MKEEMDIQREIGKQLFLINILHYENDRARKGGYSFLSRDRLAAWASMTKEELDSFIDVCGSLDPYNMATEAAMACCRKEPFKSEKNSYHFVLSTYYRMGDLFAATLAVDKFKEHCKKFSEDNYQTYSEKHKEYSVAESYSTPEIFEKVMSFYIRYLIAIIEEAISEGYAWDVISSMTRTDISEERYNSLAEVFAKEVADE